MKPSAPKSNFWFLALLLGIGGIVGKYFVSIPFVSEYNYFFLLAGYGLLVLGTTFRGF